MQSTEQNKLCFTIRMLSTIKAATPLTNNLNNAKLVLVTRRESKFRLGAIICYFAASIMLSLSVWNIYIDAQR